MTAPIDAVLSRLPDAAPTRSGWSAHCPAHGDTNASLSISVGTDGRVLLHCHAGCAPQAVVAALGLTMSDLFPQAEHGSSTSTAPPVRARRVYATLDLCIAGIVAGLGSSWRHTSTYRYSNSFAVLRFDAPEKPKQIRPVHSIDANWLIGDPSGLLPLFGIERIGTEPIVHLHEGEKCAAIAQAMGFPAITSAHGSGAAAKSDWRGVAGKTLIAFPDNDDAGRAYVEHVAKLVVKLTPPATVKVVVLPGVPERGDIEDFLDLRKAEGRSEAELRDEIAQLAARAVPLSPPGSSGGSPTGGAESSWPDPEPLPTELLPVAPFDFALLPTKLERSTRDISERMQCPPDYVAVAAMIALATVVGARIGIRPKQYDNWLVVPNLWGAVVGRPGVLKSPAIMEALRPLLQLDADARKDFQAKTKREQAEALVERAKRKESEKGLRDAVRKGDDALKIALDMVDAEQGGVRRVRFIVYDSTVEKLGEILNENPNGVLAFRDELMGLLISLDKEGQEGARSFYLEAWAGARAYTYDRIGRGTVDIASATLSLFGSIQPGKLVSYLQGATRMGGQDDGLVQRLQLLVWPDISTDWTLVDRVPDHEAREIANAVMRDIVALSAFELGGELPTRGETSIPFLRFDSAAQARFNEWLGRLERRVRGGKEHPAFESHLAKYRSLVPSLALLLHLGEQRAGPVGDDVLRCAIGWAEYLESHARRVYAFVARPEIHAAKCLASKLTDGSVKDGFDARSIYRHGWTGLADSAQVDAALSVLGSLHWVREQVTRQGLGAPRSRWMINPKILAGEAPRRSKNSGTPGEATDKTAKTSSEEHETSGPPRSGADKTDGDASSGSSVSGLPGGGASDPDLGDQGDAL